MLILQVKDSQPATAKPSELAAKLEAWLGLLSNSVKGVRVLHRQALYRHASEGGYRREHFGYVEDAAAKNTGSQPVPDASLFNGKLLLTESAAPSDIVPLGELLLGYDSSRGASVRCDDREVGHDLFRDGSFLVVRKLQQDVKALNEYVKREKKHLGAHADADNYFRGLIMGRYPDGTPVEPVKDSTVPNELSFSTGECPAFAHIRRVNPRTQLLGGIPRILRRGFTYGPKFTEQSAGLDRGLMFMAYNASIAEQFEVLQRWINGGNSTGLLSSQKDIIAGQGSISPIKYRSCAAGRDGQQGKPLSFEPPDKAHVTLDWGLYLFVPSRATLSALTLLRGNNVPVYDPRATDPDVVEGRAIIARILALEAVDPARARDLWKHTLEGAPSDADKLWKAIRTE
ncbi:MAG TPA: hypothetical protein VMF89_18375, partial [Polyangiales bacterium]|nr:hypothetical protein [Polyangiales bacterium]